MKGQGWYVFDSGIDKTRDAGVEVHIWDERIHNAGTGVKIEVSRSPEGVIEILLKDVRIYDTWHGVRIYVIWILGVGIKILVAQTLFFRFGICVQVANSGVAFQTHADWTLGGKIVDG